MNKIADPIEPIEGEACSLGDRKNIVYSSTTVTKGRGTGVVIAVGLDTEIGKIAKLVGDDDTGKNWFNKTSKTPLQKSLERMMYLCLLAAGLLSIVVFGANRWSDDTEVN